MLFQICQLVSLSELRSIPSNLQLKCSSKFAMHNLWHQMRDLSFLHLSQMLSAMEKHKLSEISLWTPIFSPPLLTISPTILDRARRGRVKCRVIQVRGLKHMNSSKSRKVTSWDNKFFHWTGDQECTRTAKFMWEVIYQNLQFFLYVQLDGASTAIPKTITWWVFIQDLTDFDFIIELQKKQKENPFPASVEKWVENARQHCLRLPLFTSVNLWRLLFKKTCYQDILYYWWEFGY